MRCADGVLAHRGTTRLGALGTIGRRLARCRRLYDHRSPPVRAASSADPDAIPPPKSDCQRGEPEILSATPPTRGGPAGEGRAMSGWPFVLYTLTGFAGLLAEQGFEKYITLLTGATAAGAAVVIFSYFLGFAAGSALAGALLERGAIRRPLRMYGTLEFLVGVSCIGFAFGFHHMVELLAPLQAHFVDPVTKFLARFAFGSILILPSATLMGASFPLIAHVVDRDDVSNGRRWARAYSANLMGASAAALLGPYLLLPSLGVRGSLWLCFGTNAFVFAVTRSLPDRSPDLRGGAGVAARRPLDVD